MCSLSSAEPQAGKAGGGGGGRRAWRRALHRQNLAERHCLCCFPCRWRGRCRWRAPRRQPRNARTCEADLRGVPIYAQQLRRLAWLGSQATMASLQRIQHAGVGE